MKTKISNIQIKGSTLDSIRTKNFSPKDDEKEATREKSELNRINK